MFLIVLANNNNPDTPASYTEDLQHPPKKLKKKTSTTAVLDISALIVCKCLSLELTKEHRLVFFLIGDRSCLWNKVIALFVVILGPILQPIELLALTMKFCCTKFHPNIVLEVARMNIISSLDSCRNLSLWELYSWIWK